MGLWGGGGESFIAQVLNNFWAEEGCVHTLHTQPCVADLVSRLTPEEKCSALDTSNPAIARLGIPHMPSGEGLHGVVTGCVSPAAPNSTGCPTSFPSPIGLGATFDKDLYLAVGGVVGTEARAVDNAGGGSGLVMYAPNIK